MELSEIEQSVLALVSRGNEKKRIDYLQHLLSISIQNTNVLDPAKTKEAAVLSEQLLELRKASQAADPTF